MITPPPPPAERSHRGGRLVLGLVLVVIGVGWFLEALGVDVPWEVVLPGALIAIGVVLVVGATSGAAQPGLIPAGVVLTVLLLLGTAIDVPLGGGVGDRTVQPTTASAVDREIELGIGKLTVDLTDVDLATLDGTLRARVGIGELVVVVPADATVRVEARAGLGNVVVFDDEEGGVDPEIVATEPGATMTLEATVGIGEVNVRRG